MFTFWKKKQFWGALIAIALLIYCVKDIRAIDIRELSSRLNYWYAIPAVLASFLFQILRGLRWRLMISHQTPIPVVQGASLYAAGQVLNTLMPVLTGQVGRMILFARKTGLRKTFIFSNIVLEVLFDAVSLKTTAQKKGGAYVLNGEKCFVPMAANASHMLVAADLDGRSQLFIVNAKNPGVKVGDREKTLGMYALEMNRVVLSNCEIPAEDRLGGEEGCDFGAFLQRSRVGMAAMAAGVTNASYQFAREYAKTRVQLDRKSVV